MVLVGAMLQRLQNGWAAFLALVWLAVSVAALLLRPEHQPTSQQQATQQQTTQQQPVQQQGQTREQAAQAAYDAAIAEGRTEAYALLRHQQVWDAWTPPAAPVRGPWHCHQVVPVLRIPIPWRTVTYYDDGRIRLDTPLSSDPTFLGGVKEIRFNGWFQRFFLGTGFIEVVYKRIEEGSERTLSRTITAPSWFIDAHREQMERRTYHL